MKCNMYFFDLYILCILPLAATSLLIYQSNMSLWGIIYFMQHCNNYLFNVMITS